MSYWAFKSIKHTPGRIIKADKDTVNDLDHDGIKFSVSEKDFGKTEKKNNIFIKVFCYENNFLYQIKNLKTVWIYWW